jgi:hypothetical protein
MNLEIQNLMTPQEILEKDIFEEPYIILPEDFKRFNDLLKYREEIRTLKLVPFKEKVMHEKYNSLDKGQLFTEVQQYFFDKNIVVKDNLYFYLLPYDCTQQLIWIKDKSISTQEIVEFISSVIEENHLNLNDIILFERPLGIKAKYIKGTFPQIRHIHFWTRK